MSNHWFSSDVTRGVSHDQRRINKAKWLAEVIQAKRVKLFVELGVYRGHNLYDLVDLCRNEPCRFVGIDVWDNDVPLDGVKYMHSRHSEKMTELYTMPQVMLVRGYSNRVPFAIQNLIEEVTTMVFIDADHHYQAVKADIAGWWNKADIMAGHDYSRLKGGVVDAVNEKAREFGVKVGVRPDNCWEYTYR